MTAMRIPVQCIVPPHMMRNLVEKGDARLRAWVMQTFVEAARIRGQREVMGLLPLAEGVGEKHRMIFDARHKKQLPGVRVRNEGDQPSSDPAVNEAYDALGATYDLFHDVFDRNSIDGKGMVLKASVQYWVDFDNAFWNGSQMIFGDGDGVIFTGFTQAIDVIGHELTHGVTQYTCQLDYHDEPGALNESMSDVFGSLVKQYFLKQTVDEADWLIGAGILAEGIHGEALRSMKAPGTAYDDPKLGKDPQPANYKSYVHTEEDNGGVHINSGIPNHAFYLVAKALGGHAWEEAGSIWYGTLQRLQPEASFQDTANLTFLVAGEVYGSGSHQQQAVRDGWAGVGIKVTAPARVTARRTAARQVVDTDGIQLEKQFEKLADRLIEVLARKTETAKR